MQMKQMSVEDWQRVLETNPQAQEQVSMILAAKERRPLATYETNCLIAYARQRVAAE
jgi:hypothetical protein